MFCAKKWLQSTTAAVTEVLFQLKLLLCFLLLLSGDIELNPGPIFDQRPDISQLTEMLNSLKDCMPFGGQLPGITDQILKTIQQEINPGQQLKALIETWFKENPNATWRDVLAALKKIKETELAQNIEGGFLINLTNW